MLLLSAYRHAGRAAFSIPIGVALRVLKAGLDEGISSFYTQILVYMKNPYRDNK